MTRLDRILRSLGEVARVRTLGIHGVDERMLRVAVETGELVRPRQGWVASRSADHDQLRAVAVGARLGCVSALSRWGVWAGVERDLHLQVPRTASRLRRPASGCQASARSAQPGVWHPNVHERRRRGRSIRLADCACDDDPQRDDAQCDDPQRDDDAHRHDDPHGDSEAHADANDEGDRIRIHWTRESVPASALDWIVSPQAALACAIRCLDAEHAAATIDSALRERVLTRAQVDGVIAEAPAHAAGLVDAFTGRPESGVESLFVRRLAGIGLRVEPQIDLAGFGRYDGLIEECVLFEVDGRGYHSGSAEFFSDRDRTLVGQAFGLPVIRPSARHVLEDWATVEAAVLRVVGDARIVRRHRGLDLT